MSFGDFLKQIAGPAIGLATGNPALGAAITMGLNSGGSKGKGSTPIGGANAFDVLSQIAQNYKDTTTTTTEQNLSPFLTESLNSAVANQQAQVFDPTFLQNQLSNVLTGTVPQLVNLGVTSLFPNIAMKSVRAGVGKNSTADAAFGQQLGQQLSLGLGSIFSSALPALLNAQQRGVGNLAQLYNVGRGANRTVTTNTTSAPDINKVAQDLPKVLAGIAGVQAAGSIGNAISNGINGILDDVFTGDGTSTTPQPSGGTDSLGSEDIFNIFDTP